MKYITIEDLKPLIKKNIVDDLSENNYDILNQLESMAISEIDANIGFKFDTNAALHKKNPFLIMCLLDILIYHFSSRMSHTGMQEIREVRYNTTKQWLKDVSIGKIVPNLPMNEEPMEYKSKNLYITEPRITNAW